MNTAAPKESEKNITLTQMMEEDKKALELEEEELLNVDLMKVPCGSEIFKNKEQKTKEVTMDQEKRIKEVEESEKNITLTQIIEEDKKALEVEEEEEEEDEEEEEEEEVPKKTIQATEKRTKTALPRVATKTVSKSFTRAATKTGGSPTTSSPVKKKLKRKIEEVVKTQQNESILYISQGSASEKLLKKAHKLVDSVDFITLTKDIRECTEYLILDPPSVTKVKDTHLICLLGNVEMITLSTLKDYTKQVFKMKEIKNFPIAEKINAFEDAIPKLKKSYSKMEYIVPFKNPNLVNILTLLKNLKLFNLDEDYEDLKQKNPLYKKIYKAFKLFKKEYDCSCDVKNLQETENNCNSCELMKNAPNTYFTFGNYMFYSRKFIDSNDIQEHYYGKNTNYLIVGEKNDFEYRTIDYATFIKGLIDLKKPSYFDDTLDDSKDEVIQDFKKKDLIAYDGLSYKIKS